MNPATQSPPTANGVHAPVIDRAESQSTTVLGFKDPAFNRILQELRVTDNVTNLKYLAAVWLVLGLTIGGTVAFDLWRQSQDLAWWWSVPVSLVTIVIVGACQHQLTGLAHEASHFTLLRNKHANDLVSDWFCMFPMFSTTHHYRLQHMAHHQFVNDPERDPDVSQLKTSGHWLKFPLEASVFVWTIIRQLWIPNLIRYIRIRAMYNAMGTDKNPYVKKGVVRSKLPVRVGLAYLALSAAAFTWTVWSGNTLLLAVIPGALYVGMMIFFSVMPAELFQQTRIKPVFSPRAMTLMRMTFFTALFAALAWTTHLTGQWAAVRFLAWWVAPMLTSFSFFMILRQLVQHGNADRGWLTNTRVFDVNPLIRCAVFPMGQDYHLPHHMFASVPHYRLKDLHEAMLKYPEYAHDAVVVEGYFLPKHRPPTAPTVLDVVGPNYAGRKDRDVFIDHSVVDESRTDDLEGIRAEERSSRLGL